MKKVYCITLVRDNDCDIIVEICSSYQVALKHLAYPCYESGRFMGCSVVIKDKLVWDE